LKLETRNQKLETRKMRFIILLLLTLASVSVNASKAVRFFRDITLNDGRIVSATLVGDENLHFYRSQSGEIILYNSKGNYYHVASQEQIDSLDAIADQQQQQASETKVKKKGTPSLTGNDSGITVNGHLSGYRLFPSKGEKKVLVLMVEFSDVSFTFGQDDFERFLNSTEMTTDVRVNGIVAKSQGSVAEYFRACSGGQLSPQFDIYGSFKLDNTAAYYSSHETTFIKDVCASAERDVDFTQYDSDGDGYVDLVYIIYAGYGANWQVNNVIWPKVKYSSGAPFCTVDDMKVHRVGMSNEINFSPTHTKDYFDNKPQMVGIGVFVHEFSHAMGITDLYATSSKSETWTDSQYDNQSMEEWSLMDGGENRLNGCLPTPLNAFERYLFGWIDDIQELTDSQTVTLTPLKAGGQPYKITGNNDNEYWILEAIPVDNEWYMRFNKNTGNGMVVTHVNAPLQKFSIDNGLPNSTPGKSGITILPADGRLIGFFDGAETNNAYEKSLLGDPFPGTQGVTQLKDYWSKDGTIDKPIYDIVQNADYSVSFTFRYLRGDANGDGEINMSDVMFIVNYTLGSPAPSFDAVAADANNDGEIDMSDAMYIVNHILNKK
jgi:immune inhibitor A